MSKKLIGLMMAAVTIGVVSQAHAQADDDGPKKPSMHSLATNSEVPKAFKDFSEFRYRPAGDRVVEQPEANRLMFWTKTGEPDGYAQQRGNSIFYYDRTGRAVRVQPLGGAQN